MNGHELRLVPIKPWGAWQARCSCGRRFRQEMSKEAAAAHYEIHVSRAKRIVGGVEAPMILMREAPVGPRTASGYPVAARPFRSFPAVDVERLMARLFGPASVLVLAWWVLWCGGVL